MFLRLIACLAFMSADLVHAQNIPSGPVAGPTLPDQPEMELWDLIIPVDTVNAIELRGAAVQVGDGVSMSLTEFTSGSGPVPLQRATLIPLQTHGDGYRLDIPLIEWPASGPVEKSFERQNSAGKPISQAAFEAAMLGADNLNKLAAFGSALQYAFEHPINLPRAQSIASGGTSLGALSGDALASRDGAVLTLTLAETSEDGDTLTWNWKYEVYGKAGSVVEGTKDAGTPMIWTKAANIKQVIVANNQRGRSQERGILYPQRDEALQGTQERGDVEDTRFERELVLIGTNLDRLDNSSISSGLTHVIYGPLRAFDSTEIRGSLGAYDAEAALDVALREADAYATRDDYQMRSVRVQLTGPVAPGLTPFTIGLQEVKWPLLYGTVYGRITLSNPEISSFLASDDPGFDLRLRDDFGRPPNPRDVGNIPKTLHFRDEVQVVVHLDTVVREGILPIFFEGAARLPEGQGTEILVYRTDDPTVFRSRSYILADAALWHNEAAVSRLPEGDIRRDSYKDVSPISTILVDEDATMRPRFDTRVEVELVDPSPDRQVTYAEHTITGDFIAALKVAAACPAAKAEGLLDRYDWDTLSVRQEDNISSWSLTGPGTDISVGQHAALIMVRARLEELIQSERDALGAVAALPANSPELIAEIQALLAGAPNRLSTLQLHPSAQRVIEGVLVQAAGSSGRAAQMAPIIAPNIKNLIVPVLATIDSGLGSFGHGAFKDCKRHELLDIAGDGADPIIQLLMSEVTRVQTGRSEVKVRRPDTVGRAALASLSTLANENAVNLNYAAEERAFIGKIATGLALGAGALAAVSEATTVTALALAGDAVDFGLTCRDNVCGYLQDQTRLARAEGAVSQLGAENLDRVRHEATETSLGRRIFDTAASAGGVFFSAADMQKVMMTRGSRAAASSLISSARAGKIASNADLAQTRTLAADIIERLRVDPGVLTKLTATEKQALTAVLADDVPSALQAGLNEILGNVANGPGLNGISSIFLPDGNTRTEYGSEMINIGLDGKDALGLDEALREGPNTVREGAGNGVSLPFAHYYFFPNAISIIRN